jgi:hypothetical protein
MEGPLTAPPLRRTTRDLVNSMLHLSQQIAALASRQSVA